MTSESELVEGHGPMLPKVQPCACGRAVVVDAPGSGAILLAVMAHNETPEHRRYSLELAERRSPTVVELKRRRA